MDIPAMAKITSPQTMLRKTVSTRLRKDGGVLRLVNTKKSTTTTKAISQIGFVNSMPTPHHPPFSKQ